MYNKYTDWTNVLHWYKVSIQQYHTLMYLIQLYIEDDTKYILGKREYNIVWPTKQKYIHIYITKRHLPLLVHNEGHIYIGLWLNTNSTMPNSKYNVGCMTYKKCTSTDRIPQWVEIPLPIIVSNVHPSTGVELFVHGFRTRLETSTVCWKWRRQRSQFIQELVKSTTNRGTNWQRP